MHNAHYPKLSLKYLKCNTSVRGGLSLKHGPLTIPTDLATAGRYTHSNCSLICTLHRIRCYHEKELTKT